MKSKIVALAFWVVGGLSIGASMNPARADVLLVACDGQPAQVAADCQKFGMDNACKKVDPNMPNCQKKNLVNECECV